MDSGSETEHGLDVCEQLPDYVLEGWSDDEILFRACSICGVVIDFSLRSSSQLYTTRIRAAVIRHGLLECAHHGSQRQRGIEVRGAHIEGDLDLSDAKPLNGVPLPPLTLANCRVDGDIDLRGAYLTALNLTACEVGDIHGEKVDVEQSIIGHRHTPSERPQSQQNHI